MFQAEMKQTRPLQSKNSRQLYGGMFRMVWMDASFHWRISPVCPGEPSSLRKIFFWSDYTKNWQHCSQRLQVNRLLLRDSATCLPTYCSACRKQRHHNSRFGDSRCWFYDFPSVKHFYRSKFFEIWEASPRSVWQLGSGHCCLVLSFFILVSPRLSRSPFTTWTIK